MARIGFSLSDYWLIIRKRKWVVILCFAAVYLSVIFHVQRQTPVYRATCSIRMIERKSASDMITQMVSYTSYDVMASLSKVVLGRPIIEKVVYELGLADKHTPPEKLDDIILGVQKSAKTEKEMGENILNITVENKDPRLAAKITNTIAEVFIKADMEEKNELARNMRIFLEEQVAIAKQRLTDTENKLTSFREKGAVSGIGVTLQNDIANLERQNLELKKIYTEKYPDVVRINEQIGRLKKELQTLPESEIEYARLVREVEVNEASYRLLQGRLEGVRIAEAEKVPDVKIVDPAMIPRSPVRPNKQLASLLGLVVGLVIGVFMSFVVETLDTSIGTIEDLQSLLKIPVLAVIPYINPQSKEKKAWDWLLHLPLLNFKKKKHGAISEDIEHMKQQLLIRFPQKSSATEAYRILRTNIKIEELLKNDRRILLVTSTIPKEGKSITSLNLALALAQNGHRTLLVDCDLRKAVLHKVFGINKEPGLSDILLGVSKPEVAVRNFIDIMLGDESFPDAVKVPGLDNFHLLPCGQILTNPAELLDSEKVREVFSSLKSQYNFLVLDCPPVLPVPDTIILGRKVAEKVYLVYRAGYTSKMAIVRAKEQLDMAKQSPEGIILNSASPESEIVSDYYHHYYYYRYYSEKD